MSDAMFSVQDQVVLISGATRGIGRAIAEGFASRGAKVIVTGRVAETAHKAAEEMSTVSGGQVVAKVCDVADVPAGQVVDTCASHVDAYPFILECAGEADERSVTAEHPGTSLFALASGARPDRTVLSEYHAMGSTTGALWTTDNAGDTWNLLTAHLPPIYQILF